MAKRPQGDARPPSTPDEVEQHQRADGAHDAVDAPVDEDGEPLGPDEVEHRHGGTVDVAAGEPLTPDMIEQRQIVEYDEDEERPAP